MNRTTRLLLPLVFGLTIAAGPSFPADDGAWIQHLPPGIPSRQEQQGGVWDPVRARMIFFGGYDGQSELRMTRALTPGTPPVWSVLATTGPAARYEHSLVYDPVRDRVLLFGGRDKFANRFGDVWALSLAGTPTWVQLATAGTPPSARSGHEAIYDPVRDRMVVFGGVDGLHKNDVWALSLAGTPTWTQLSPAGTPPMGREYGVSVYDDLNDRLILFGGSESDDIQPTLAGNDTWALSFDGTPTWTQLSPAGTPPRTRILHEAVWDGPRGRMIVFGGWGGSWLDDTWALNLNGPPEWVRLNPTGSLPHRRSGMTFVYSPPLQSAILYGGRDSLQYFSDSWTLKLSSTPAQWTNLSPAGPAVPGTRMSHEGVYDPLRRKLVVFGGYDYDKGYLNDVWAYDLDGTPAWTRLDAGPTRPAIRGGSALVAQPSADRLVLYGGQNFSGHLGDLWQFNLATRQWATLSATGSSPGTLVIPSALYDAARNRMLVFGGLGASGPKNDIWELTLGATPTWTLLSPSGPKPPARYGQAMVLDTARDRLVVFGGYDSNTFFGDVWALDLAGSLAWTQISPAGPGPGPRYAHEMIYDPLRDRLVVFGGFSGSSFNNLVFALDLASQTWTQLSPALAQPAKRDLMATIYDPTLDRLVVMGGNSDDSYSPLDDVWSLNWTGLPVPVLLALVEESVVRGAVTLTWFTPDGPGRNATVYRRADGSEWETLGTLVSDVSGRFVLEDRVDAGGRFAYRIEASGVSTEAHWVTIPGSLAFALESAWPNPSAGAMQVRMRLPDPLPASLELIDVRGRSVLRRNVAGAGLHTVDLAGDTKLAPGVYVIRLVQGTRSQRLKVAVIR